MKFGDIELEKNVEVTLNGTVIFELTNVGNKSEAIKPFLYKNRDAKIQIFKKGDNPFENHELDAYDGKTVELLGSLGRGNVFNITAINEVLAEKAPEIDESADSVEPVSEEKV